MKLLNYVNIVLRKLKVFLNRFAPLIIYSRNILGKLSNIINSGSLPRFDRRVHLKIINPEKSKPTYQIISPQKYETTREKELSVLRTQNYIHLQDPLKENQLEEG